MTKKDYIKIAEAVRTTRLFGRRTDADLYDALSNALADVMADDNPRFDRERFLTACGVS